VEDLEGGFGGFGSKLQDVLVEETASFAAAAASEAMDKSEDTPFPIDSERPLSGNANAITGGAQGSLELQASNRDARSKKAGLKQCGKCGQWKPKKTQFSKNQAKKANGKCTDCA